MRSNRNAPAIGMPIALVGSPLANKEKTVARQSGDELSCRERTKDPIIDPHAL